MSGPKKSRLRIFPYLALFVFIVPISLGLIGTWMPAFAYLPVIGADEFSLEAFRLLLGHPSLPGALRSTLVSGLCATLLSLIISLWIALQLHGSRFWLFLEGSLSPLLAIPHAAFAIGFSFLIAPSGWLMRLTTPGLTGFSHPPDWSTTGDPWALSLTITMIFKEVPFLLLMIIGGTNQLDIRRTVWVGRSLGYHRFQLWRKLILPQLYPMLRLPVLTVLAYSLSVVDLALISGPSVPPTLAVLIDRWFNDPDVSYRLIGAAGATLLCLLTVFFIACFLVTEILVARLTCNRLVDGERRSLLDNLRQTAPLCSVTLLVTTGFSLAALVLWSFTRSWRFPDALPQQYTGHYWFKSLPLLADPLFTSGLAGIVSSVIGIVLVLGCFENERYLAQARISSLSQKSLWVMYLPLLIPQIGFLFGIQATLTVLHLEGTWASLIWVHLVFVLPYIFLTLANTYRSYDQRFTQVATILGGSPWRSFIRVKLPMLAKPILFSMAIGFAVSIAQYLPTLYVGAGRFATITTETVSLASGSDRRVVAVYALCQFVLPLIVYSSALLLPAAVFRNRRAMQN